MIKKYTYGTPFPTESVTEQFAASEGMPEFGVIHLQEGFSLKKINASNIVRIVLDLSIGATLFTSPSCNAP